MQDTDFVSKTSNIVYTILKVLACILKILLQRICLALDGITYHACIKSPEIEFHHKLNTFHTHDDKVC